MEEVIFMDCVHPPKLFEKIMRGRKIELSEIAKQGFVIFFCSSDEDDIKQLSNFKNFVNVDAKSLIIDVDKLEDEWIMVCNFIYDSQKVSKRHIFWLFSVIGYLKEFYGRKDVLNNERPPGSFFGNRFEILISEKPLHCSIISTHEHLIGPAFLDELTDSALTNIRNKFTKKPTKIRKRNPIDSRLRHEVFKRDGYRCVECGNTNKTSVLEIDHIIPVSRGGSDELDNLQTMCYECNKVKNDKVYTKKEE